MSRITAIIPAYNAGPFLREAVQSALAQRPPLDAVLVVDDGSTDGCIETIADLPVTVLATGGGAHAAGARNLGLAAVPEGLVAFLDADDVWDPGHVAQNVALLERFPEAVLSYTRVRRITGWSGEAERWGPHEVPWDPRLALIEANRIQPSATVVRCEAIRRAGGFSPVFPGVEDVDLWLRLARLGPVVGSHAVTVSYRVHPAQTTQRTGEMRRKLWGVLVAYATQEASGSGALDAALKLRLRRRLRRDLAAAWREADVGTLRALQSAAARLDLGAVALLSLLAARSSAPLVSSLGQVRRAVRALRAAML